MPKASDTDGTTGQPIVCSQCQGENPVGAKQCIRCGAALPDPDHAPKGAVAELCLR